MLKAQSLFVYLFFYLLSVCFFSADEREFRGRLNGKVHIKGLIGVLILACMAGLRSSSVGTDAFSYGETAMNSAVMSNSLNSYLMQKGGGEVIYNTCLYLCSHLTNSVQLWFGIVNFATTYSLYKAALIFKDKINCTFFMLVYMLLYFPMSFNIMQQFLAASILMLALAHWFETKNRKTSVVLAVIAYGIHSSAIIGIVFYVILRQMMKKNTAVKRLAFGTVFTVVFSTLIYYWELILNWFFNSVGFLSAYSTYFDVFKGSSNTQLNLFVMDRYAIYEMVFRTLFLIIILISRIEEEEYRVFLKYAAVLNFVSYMVFRIVFHTVYGYRIVLYLDLLSLLCYSFGLQAKNFSMRKFAKKEFVVLLLSAAYFFAIYYLSGAHEVIPYRFFV